MQLLPAAVVLLSLLLLVRCQDFAEEGPCSSTGKLTDLSKSGLLYRFSIHACRMQSDKLRAAWCNRALLNLTQHDC